MFDYEFIVKRDLDDLNKTVTEFLNKGYQLHGPPSVIMGNVGNNQYFSQAVIKCSVDF